MAGPYVVLFAVPRKVTYSNVLLKSVLMFPALLSFAMLKSAFSISSFFSAFNRSQLTDLFFCCSPDEFKTSRTKVKALANTFRTISRF